MLPQLICESLSYVLKMSLWDQMSFHLFILCVHDSNSGYTCIALPVPVCMLICEVIQFLLVCACTEVVPASVVLTSPCMFSFTTNVYMQSPLCTLMHRFCLFFLYMYMAPIFYIYAWFQIQF